MKPSWCPAWFLLLWLLGEQQWDNGPFGLSESSWTHQNRQCLSTCSQNSWKLPNQTQNYDWSQSMRHEAPKAIFFYTFWKLNKKILGLRPKNQIRIKSERTPSPPVSGSTPKITLSRVQKNAKALNENGFVCEKNGDSLSTDSWDGG